MPNSFALEKSAGTRIEIIHPLTAKEQHVLSGMAMCLSTDPTKIVDIKMIIQSIPGWDCDTFIDGASFDAHAPGLVVVDASALNDELPRLDQLKQAFPRLLLLCFMSRHSLLWSISQKSKWICYPKQ